MANTNTGYNASQKITKVADRLGMRALKKQQGTSRIVYDVTDFNFPTVNSIINFFENVQNKRFPFTNLPQNKLEPGETMVIQQIFFAAVNYQKTEASGAPPVGTIRNVVPFSYYWSYGLYRSDFSIIVGEQRVVKDVSYSSAFAPFNRNAQFLSTMNLRNTDPLSPDTQLGFSHDVYTFKNDVVIPPQTQFTVPVQYGIVAVPAGVGKAGEQFAIMCSLEGYGTILNLGGPI